MREIAIGAGCVVALLIGFAVLRPSVDTSVRSPSHAMELAGVRAEAQAAKSEADQAKAEVEKLKAELKKATEGGEKLKARVAELEKTQQPKSP